MTGKEAAGFGVDQSAKNAHSHSYVSLFAMQRYPKRCPGLPVGLGLT